MDPLNELKNEMIARFSALEKLVDRRVSEMSAEIAASVEFMELNDERLRKQLKDVRTVLSQVADDSSKDFWKNGGMELEFIVDVTEKAANTIMDATDEICSIVNKSGDLSEETKNLIGDAVSKIFEACSFQDLVGQRVRRVNDRLKAVDEALSQAIGSTGHDATNNQDEEGEVRQPQVDAMLGSESSASQASIDAMFD